MILKECCQRCGTRLDADRRCPGDYELRVYRGERCADAAQLVHRLGVTMAWVRNRSRSDRGDALDSMRVGRKVYFRYALVARLERDERLAAEGRLDSTLVSA